MSATGLDHREFGYSEPGDQIDFAAEVTVVVRVGAEAGAGCWAGAAARQSGHVVSPIMCVGQPEEISFERHGKPRVRFDGEDRADRMDVLQRKEIHVAVKLVVGGVEIVKGLVFVVAA